MISAWAVVIPVFCGIDGDGVVLYNLFRFQRVDIRCVDGDTRDILVPGVDAGSVRDDIRLCRGNPRFCGVDGDGIVLNDLFRFEGIDVRCVDGDTGNILVPGVDAGSVRDDIRLCRGNPCFGSVYGDGVVLCNLFVLESIDVLWLR